MIGREFIVGVALVCLQNSLAFAGDVVTFRCDFPEQGKIHAHWSDVVADEKGISITDYHTDKDTGKLVYVKSYAENSKEDTKQSHYRMNSVEIALETTYNIVGTIVNLKSSINLRSGIQNDDSNMISKGKIDEQPTQTGHCKPN